MIESIGWGILGCGDVVEHKSGPALWGTPGSSVVAVMRRNREKAADFARRHQIPRFYDDADALLADPAVNAVYIATLPDSHAELTVKAANAGKRVLVEKPMARNADECAAMIDACHTNGVSLHVAYYRRFYPKFVHAKKLIDDGAIGQIASVSLTMGKPKSSASGDVSWRLRPELSGGGLFWDTGSHRVDIVRMLCGGIAEVKGFSENLTRRAPADDALACAFRLQSGAVGTVLCLFDAAPLQRDRLEIVGANGILTFDSFDADHFSLTRADGTTETFMHPNPSPVHGPFVHNLLRVYAGEPIAHVTGEEGAATNRVLEAMGG